MMKRALILVAPLLLLGACGGSDDASSSDTGASTVSDIPQLTFDGSTCVYEGPVEVTAGAVVVEFVNDSDGTANVGVLLLDEGETVQNVVDEAGPGSFTVSDMSVGVSDMGGQNPAGAGETMRWESGLAAGEYVVTCTQRGNNWFGSGFTVVNG